MDKTQVWFGFVFKFAHRLNVKVGNQHRVESFPESLG